jgi:pimeloyl-ACP methyl ester carboxylesterase
MASVAEQEFRAQVGGGEIAGWRSGATGPPALLLHGGPGISNRGEATEADKLEQMSLVWPYYFGDPSAAPPMPAFHFDSTAIKTWESIVSHFRRRTLERALPAIELPVLVTHGDRSPVPAIEAKRTAALMRHARLVIHHGRGHFPWLEEPGWVRGVVSEFIGDA